MVMKKYLFLLTALLFCGINGFGQSLNFNNLVYFANLTNRQVFDNLLEGNKFRQEYTMQVNGQELEYFRSIGKKANSEKIIIGSFTKLNDGTVLRTVNYTSTDPQNIINMIGQVKRYGLTLKFRGVDDFNNIYLFDNDFYRVSIYLRRDKKSGLVEIKQKEFLGLE